MKTKINNCSYEVLVCKTNMLFIKTNGETMHELANICGVKTVIPITQNWDY
jgi:hypothetical protein